MTILYIILIILVAVALSLFVLVQNPKGGGLAGNIAGFSTQFMGVKQTNDVLEKGTWIFATALALLCLLAPIFIGTTTSNNDRLENVGSGVPVQQQSPVVPNTNTNTNTVPVPQAADSNQ